MTITTIVQFAVPAEHRDQFLELWHETQRLMLSAPGALDGVLHRCIDAESPVQFVNVARWRSQEDLAEALDSAARERARQGVDAAEVMARLGVRMSQHDFAEEVTY